MTVDTDQERGVRQRLDVGVRRFPEPDLASLGGVAHRPPPHPPLFHPPSVGGDDGPPGYGAGAGPLDVDLLGDLQLGDGVRGEPVEVSVLDRLDARLRVVLGAGLLDGVAVDLADVLGEHRPGQRLGGAGGQLGPLGVSLAGLSGGFGPHAVQVERQLRAAVAVTGLHVGG
jgi:hypothetical protein